jgi:hypothetical protein
MVTLLCLPPATLGLGPLGEQATRPAVNHAATAEVGWVQDGSVSPGSWFRGRLSWLQLAL